MARQPRSGAGRRGRPAPEPAEAAAERAARAQRLESDARPVGGVPGPGRWLVATYVPTALFSLKVSAATSAVGKTLLVPTMYAIKMALVDAAFRAGYREEDCARLLRALVDVDVRVAPSARAVVTHTFLKIRQEPKTPSRERPYISSIAYREVVHAAGEWRWAFDLASLTDEVAGWLVELLPHVNYVGRRGSFIQFVGLARQGTLSIAFTQPRAEAGFQVPSRWHVAPLDDFGPEASLDVLSSYAPATPRRDRHRRFVQTIIPLGLVNVGPGFSEYERAD
ncbi:MAG TPA: hypothetical protein VFB73_05430 [Chloroflexota bacterium]|nr:hypothetical protein [Chloroflexota bacterium]